MARDRKRHAECQQAPETPGRPQNGSCRQDACTRASLHGLLRALAREAARTDHRDGNSPG
ncbi:MULTISPECIES: hypothetical protein [unclassified Leisingera]|uniref:hypothetical protein n=1 Tax=unclassified Leisingera TaxID=2614906 RepID=UPI0013E93EDE|nr:MULTISPECIES: hypothetical protein [unclassified Leisingera]